jgi:hypothetical protein
MPLTVLQADAGWLSVSLRSTWYAPLWVPTLDHAVLFCGKNRNCCLALHCFSSGTTKCINDSHTIQTRKSLSFASICPHLLVRFPMLLQQPYTYSVPLADATLRSILGWVGCILLRYNEMGDFCCTIHATYIFFVISYYTVFHNMFRLLLSHLQVWLYHRYHRTNSIQL